MWRGSRLRRSRAHRKRRIRRVAFRSSAREEPMLIFRLQSSPLSSAVFDDADLAWAAMDLIFECERRLWRWVRSSFRRRDDRLDLVGMMVMRCGLSFIKHLQI